MFMSVCNLENFRQNSAVVSTVPTRVCKTDKTDTLDCVVFFLKKSEEINLRSRMRTIFQKAEILHVSRDNCAVLLRIAYYSYYINNSFVFF